MFAIGDMAMEDKINFGKFGFTLAILGWALHGLGVVTDGSPDGVLLTLAFAPMMVVAGLEANNHGFLFALGFLIHCIGVVIGWIGLRQAKADADSNGQIKAQQAIALCLVPVLAMVMLSIGIFAIMALPYYVK